MTRWPSTKRQDEMARLDENERIPRAPARNQMHELDMDFHEFEESSRRFMSPRMPNYKPPKMPKMHRGRS